MGSYAPEATLGLLGRGAASALIIASLGLSLPVPAWGAADMGPGCNPKLPVLTSRAGGAVSLPPDAASPVVCATQTGYASSESSLAASGEGVLVYSPAETENSAVRSTDGGSTWSLTYPAVEQPTSFWNTIDPFMIADRRTGRLFWSHATGPVRNEGGLPQGSGFYLAAAAGFQVFSSSDAGRSWTTADYSTAPTGDWEKLAVGPPPPGASPPHGYPDVVYLCANSPFEVSGPGRLCYKSLDGGVTFSVAGYMSPTASNPQDSCPPLNFNVGVVDANGTFYTPADCQRAAYVVITQDEGASYTWRPIPDAPTSGPAGGPLVELAVDDAGTLYALWSATDKLDLEVSHDGARTWSAPIVASAPGVHGIDHPWLAAGARGHVAVTYYASPSPGASMLDAYITQTDDALASQPLFYSGMLNDPTHPIYHDYGLSFQSPRVDFVGGQYDPPGATFWSGVVQQLGPPDSNGYIQTTGLVGRLAFIPPPPPQQPPARAFVCAQPSGRLTGLALGPVRLGMSRSSVRHLFTGVATRGRRFMDFFCPSHGGIRVGYPSPRLLARLSQPKRRQVRGRAVLILTANRLYALDGVRTGTPLATAARRLKIGRGFHVGLNWWYLLPGAGHRSRGVLKVRHGVIEEIGIARPVTKAPLAFLRSFY